MRPEAGCSLNNFLLYGLLVCFTNSTLLNLTMKQFDLYDSKVPVTPVQLSIPWLFSQKCFTNTLHSP